MNMDRFDKKGMILIPNPVPKRTGTVKVLVVCEVFCPAGHSLISERAVFNGYPGILLGVGLDENKGLVALSPIYGDKTRISVDIDLPVDRIVSLFCPTCGIDLPRYATCGCGSDLTALFLTRYASFNDCIGVCNRIGCINARFVTNGELISEAMLETL
jgi:hypothetical protein